MVNVKPMLVCSTIHMPWMYKENCQDIFLQMYIATEAPDLKFVSLQTQRDELQQPLASRPTHMTLQTTLHRNITDTI